MISNNAITNNIDINHRMMISKKTIFRVSMIDDFTNEGLFSMTLIQTVFNSKDDKENKIAYIDEVIEEISGDDYIFLGSEAIYKCNGATFSTESDYVTLINSENECRIKCKTDTNLIGKKFELSAMVNGNVIKKVITIKGVF